MKIFLILFIVAIVVSACEGASDLGLNPPYQEKIVIHGFLSAGDTVQNIEVIRLRDFSGDTVIAIPDAKVILHDGIQDYQLQLQPIHPSRTTLAGRTYYYAPGLVAKAGQTYKLTVEWRQKKAEAITFVPQPLLPDSVSIAPSPDNNNLVVKAWIRPRSNEAYILYQSHLFKQPTEDSLGLQVTELGASELVRRQTPNKDSIQQLTSFLLTLGETARFRQIYPNLEQFNSVAVLYAFDIAIWDYIIMRDGRRSGVSDSFVYVSQPTEIRGNIKGDGIGLFVGVATSRTPVRKTVR
jgi:hypothetical protein